MRTIVIDGREISSRRESHAYFKERLSLPDYYGSNLDALSDCLGEISEVTNLVIYHYDEMERKLGSYAASILKVMIDMAKNNPFLTISFDIASKE